MVLLLGGESFIDRSGMLWNCMISIFICILGVGSR
jgi:hypothetical protein